MRTYTVTGLLDEQDGDLYVAASHEGRHPSADTTRTTDVPGFGQMTRFLSYIEADTADEAERIAIDIAKHYADDDAALWAPGKGYRRVESVDTDLT